MSVPSSSATSASPPQAAAGIGGGDLAGRIAIAEGGTLELQPILLRDAHDGVVTLRLNRPQLHNAFDATLIAALAPVTEQIGLVATASTTFDEPYHIARRFASLDHISGGRAGWNIVTTSNPDAALNFGMDEHMEHGERYHRAREFYDVVTGLWDSWADDAFIRDVESGVFFDPDKLHVLNHHGPHLNVRGPLNIARPVQGFVGEQPTLAVTLENRDPQPHTAPTGAILASGKVLTI